MTSRSPRAAVRFGARLAVLAAVVLFGSGLGIGPGAGVAAAEDLPDPSPVPSLPPIEPAGGDAGPAVVIPAGCSTAQQPRAVFVGELALLPNPTTARFRVVQLRAGSTEGFEVGGLIDVGYGSEIRFLDGPGARYVVGAGIDRSTGLLFSRVHEAAPLFGGSDVVGADRSDVECPRLDDPIRTLHQDGTPVDTGLFSPLKGSGGRVLAAVLQPVLWAFLLLVALIGVKHLVVTAGRGLEEVGRLELHPVETRRPR